MELYSRMWQLNIDWIESVLHLSDETQNLSWGDVHPPHWGNIFCQLARKKKLWSDRIIVLGKWVNNVNDNEAFGELSEKKYHFHMMLSGIHKNLSTRTFWDYLKKKIQLVVNSESSIMIQNHRRWHSYWYWCGASLDSAGWCWQLWWSWSW